MSTQLTKEDVERIIGEALRRQSDLHARIHVSRGTTVIPGQAVKEEFFNAKVEVDVPSDNPKIIDAIHRAKADLEVLVGEFKAAHLDAKPRSENRTQNPKTERSFDVEKILQPEQMELVDQTRVGNILMIKPKRWLGEELWSAINDQIRAVRGKWIPAALNSHWEVPL